MAPLSSEPRQVAIVLNVARRKALYQLASEITAYMRSELELDDKQKYDRPSPASPGSGPTSPSPGSAADLFAVPSNNGSETDVNASQKQTPPSPQLIALRKAALRHFDEWRKDFLTKLREIVASPDDNKLLEERRKRQEKLAQKKLDTPTEGENLIDFGGDAVAEQGQDMQDAVATSVSSLQALYHPIPTRLTTISEDDRKEVLSAVLILLLSSGNYSAYSRCFVAYLTSAFGLPLSVLINEETEVARTMIEASAEAEKAKEGMSAEAEAQKRKQENQSSRYWKVGLASVAGAAVIGITGGLAAPVVAGAIGGLMGTVGLGSLASFLGIFWMNGALVGALFGAYGAHMTGEMVDKYAREVEDFRFLPLKDEWGSEYAKEDNKMRRLRVTIGINGWLKSTDEVTKPWRVLGDESEVFALRYEMNSLMKLGTALKDLVSSYAWGYVKSEIIKRTVLATLWSALWPLSILKMASNLDNPFSLARNRSEKAGMILADALINKVQGERPVTLVGYSLGARVIYACLKSLAERKAFGLIDTVVLIGAPVPSNRNHWLMMRSVVGGKMFNVYSENDFILAFMYRATSIQLGIAGLQGIQEIEGVNNLDLSEEVQGHLRYPDLIAPILARCGFPSIKGGEKPIEKEEDTSIQLQDSEGSGQMGTLIDIGDKSKDPPKPVAVKPLGRSGREIAFPTGIERTNSGSRPVVTKAKTEPLSAADYELSGPAADPGPVEQKVLLGPKNPALPPRPTGDTTRTISEPPPPYSPGKYGGMSSSRATEQDEHVDTDDEDDDNHGGISMVNNDEDDDGDMVTYMEPLRLEDQE